MTAHRLLKDVVMSSHTFDFGSQLERLMNDRRVRIGGAIAGAVVFATSLIAVNISHKPPRSKYVAAEVSPNLPIMRYLPYPEPRKGDVVSVRAPGSKARAPGVLTARR